MMTRRQFCKSATALTALSLVGSRLVFAGPLSEPVNVLWIVVDDMGFGDLCSTGRTNFATPNIDRIAREGVFLENARVYPVCTATRAALLTGHSPQRNGLEGVLLPGSTAGLKVNSTGAAKEFKAAGYRTALIGKWHCGDTAAAHPNAQGFDDFFGFLWGETGYYTHTKEVGGVDELDFHQNGTTSDIKGYTTDLYGTRAISFLRENQSRPFFLMLSYNAPHYYLDAPAEYQNRYTGGAAAKLYAGAMNALDDSVGRVLDELDRLGLADNTLVVFTTDNGAPTGEGRNLPYSGAKNSLMEGGVRSPMSVRLPGVIPAGHRCRQNFSAIDLLPTSLALAGVTTGTAFEGKNRAALLTSSGAVNADPVCMRYVYGGKVHRLCIKANWKLHYDENTGATRLYDLGADPTESTDLAAGNPDTAAELKAAWNVWSSTFSPNLGTW